MPDYSYINARVRSMESDLLTEEQLREMITSPELPVAISHLKKTVYGLYYPEGPEEIEVPLISKADSAIRNALSVSMKKMLALFKGESEDLMKIILGRWDVFNIKTLIRGRLNNLPSEEVLSAAIPCGSLDEGILRELYKQTSVHAVIDMMLTIGYVYAVPLKKFQYVNSGDLFQGEVALEKSFFEYVFRCLKTLEVGNRDVKIVKDIMERLIDRFNLITAVRIADAGIHSDEAGNYFIEGGRLIPLSVYQGIAGARDISEGISLIRNSYIRKQWEDYASASHMGNSALLVERWLDHEMLIHAVRLPRQDPLNIGLSISLIWKKINEVINLRSILRGIHFHQSQDEIEKLFIIV